MNATRNPVVAAVADASDEMMALDQASPNPTPVTTTAEDAQEVGAVPLPCPFCGHSGLSFSEGSTFRWLVAACEGCGASAGETRIQTLGEGARAEWRAQAQRDAIAEWNKRAPVAVATSDAERAALPPAFAKLTDARSLARVLRMSIKSGVLAPLADELCTSLEAMVLALEAHRIEVPAAPNFDWNDQRQAELNDWFLNLPEGRRKVLLDGGRWELAGAAFNAGRALPIDFKQATDQGGWQWVPKEPTDAMLTAASHASMQHLLDCIKDPAKADALGSEENIRKTYANRYQSMLAAAPPVTEDLSALVARLARALRKAAPGNDLAEKAMDYLRRKGLQGSPLRAAPTLLGVADGYAVGGKSGGAA